MNINNLELYMVQNRDGKWLRSLGRGGYKQGCWVEDPKDAKIYTKIGQARARVTFFSNNYPAYGSPVIVKLTITSAEQIDESSRIAKIKFTKERAEKRRELARKADRLSRAKEEFEKAKSELENAEKG